MQCLICCAFTLGLLCSGLGHAAIYRCVNEAGHHTYTDRPCPGQQRYIPSTNPQVRFTPIAAADRKRLAQAEQRDQQQRQAQRKARAARHQQQVAQRAERAARCASASAELEALLAARRKGYSLQAQRQLDTREAALKLSKRQNC
jgi:hypothetical protein